MKTNQLKFNRISILFSLIAILFFSFNCEAQLKLSSTGGVSVGNLTAPYTGIYSLSLPPINGSATAIACTGNMPSGSGYAYGVYGISSRSTAISAGRAYGVYGVAGNSNPGYNYAVYGKLTGTNNGAAIFASVNGADAAIPGQWAAYFDGKIRTTNDSPDKPTAGSWSGYSDLRLKNNVASFKDGLDVLRRINPVTYKFNGVGGLSTEETHIGVIAQDIKQVAPYCVSTGRLVVKQSESSGFSGSELIESLPADSSGEALNIVAPLTYNYDGLIYVMINSIKQLDSVNTALAKKDSIKDLQLQMLQNKLSLLDSVINTCCSIQSVRSAQSSSNTSLANQTDVRLADVQSIILEQNVPNPFAEQTSIAYNLPNNTIKAQMLFYNSQGKLIQSTELTQKGRGILNVFASDLSNGIYTYTLVVDGKVIETKKMVKQ